VPDELLEVGQVVKPHGLQGEVVVHLVTNRLERLAPGSRLACRPSQRGPRARGEGAPGGPRPAAPAAPPPAELEVVAARPHGRTYLVRFAGVDDIDAAEALRAIVLFAEPIEDPSALFVHDLIGAEVLDAAGTSHGRVTGVEANPASDLLVVEGRWYVPLRFVVEHTAGRVVVEVPEGIFE